MNYKEAYYKHYGLEKCDILYCAFCGMVAVNLHHIEYGAGLKNNHHTNLIPLCFKHHNGHHTQNNPTTEEIKHLKECSRQ